MQLALIRKAEFGGVAWNCVNIPEVAFCTVRLTATCRTKFDRGVKFVAEKFEQSSGSEFDMCLLCSQRIANEFLCPFHGSSKIIVRVCVTVPSLIETICEL